MAKISENCPCTIEKLREHFGDCYVNEAIEATGSQSVIDLCNYIFDRIITYS